MNIRHLSFICLLAIGCSTTSHGIDLWKHPTGLKIKGTQEAKDHWTPDLGPAIATRIDNCRKWWLDKFPDQTLTIEYAWNQMIVKIIWFPDLEAIKNSHFRFYGRLQTPGLTEILWPGDQIAVIWISGLICHELGHRMLMIQETDHGVMQLSGYGY